MALMGHHAHLTDSQLVLLFVFMLKYRKNSFRPHRTTIGSKLKCGPGSNPRPGVISGLSFLSVLVLAPRDFLWVLRFSSFHKNQHILIPIRSGIRGPRVCQSQGCYVLPS